MGYQEEGTSRSSISLCVRKLRRRVKQVLGRVLRGLRVEKGVVLGVEKRVVLGVETGVQGVVMQGKSRHLPLRNLGG